MEKILLGEKKSKKSINEDNLLNVNLCSNEHVLPVDNMTKTLDSYDEYLSEKDNSDVYRLIFTINPVCTNILFNAITECVYKEGSNECNTLNFVEFTDTKNRTGMWYCRYKGFARRSHNYCDVDYGRLMADTAFSHPKIGPVVYHCGVNIFNNHMLRKRGLKVVNQQYKNWILSDVDWQRNYCGDFNTLKDGMRYSDGTPNWKDFSTAEWYHLYQFDDIKSFQESVHDGLCESDGWVGFINPVTLDIPNFIVNEAETSIAINKCLNNRNAGEFIDMYPDRTLFSFIPKYNEYRNRLEYNWDCIITYPYRNIEDNPLIVDGLECYFNDLSELMGSYLEGSDGKTNFLLSFKTKLKNNFYSGSFLRFIFISKETGKRVETEDLVKVEGIGINGEDTQHVFHINFSSILNCLISLGITKNNINLIEVRVKKNVKGADCKYYIREFRRLPNFKDTDVYISDRIPEESISAHTKDGFTNSLNALAFAENIYSDKIAQIVFGDDIVTTGIRDNLGRKLSELYLTIIKRNKGHEKWYDSGITNTEDIEYSHCFGNVSSGLDLPPDSGYTKYNVHRLTAENRQANAFEENIVDTADTFYGDVVEFSPYTLEETVLEVVYHRFNTEQRETKAKTPIDFSELSYQEIICDDYDVSCDRFTIDNRVIHNANNNPEGYYYKPHYRIKLREFEETVKQGSHIKMRFSEISGTYGIEFSGITSVPYGLNKDDILYLIKPETGERLTARVTEVSGKLGMEISFSAETEVTISEYSIFKPNILKPDYAYELNDGTGRYIWRDMLPENKIMYGDELYDSMFTNGAHYFHQNINFYLKRQDPSGEYGLNKINSDDNNFSMDMFTGAARGEFKNISEAEVQVEGENDIC